MTQLEGRTVVVTGASAGIGRAVALAAAAEGASVVAVGRDRRRLGEVVEQLPDGEHQAVAMDVRDNAAWLRLSDSASAIDGLVCAAGTYGPIGRIETVDPGEFADTFDINVGGSVRAVRACLPRLREASGSVVLFAGGGADALPGYDAYVGSKAAVVRLAENLAAELGADGVRVNSVAPGFIATGIHQATLNAGPEAAGADFHANTVAALAAGGFPVAEAAALVVWLLASESAPLTGRLVSARWDQWRDHDWLARVVQDPHLLTMRRIDDALFTAAGSAPHGVRD
jgi:3-oxoacyl-[acyl-carrier protein] reductase